MTKRCVVCGKEVSWREHLKVTHALVGMKIYPRKVFCSIECAMEYVDGE